MLFFFFRVRINPLFKADRLGMQNVKEFIYATCISQCFDHLLASMQQATDVQLHICCCNLLWVDVRKSFTWSDAV